MTFLEEIQTIVITDKILITHTTIKFKAQVLKIGTLQL